MYTRRDDDQTANKVLKYKNSYEKVNNSNGVEKSRSQGRVYEGNELEVYCEEIYFLKTLVEKFFQILSICKL